jgi:GNAT superfamily N-acetyltransferase
VTQPGHEPAEPLRIRPATPEDAAALARLRYEFRAALNEPEETEQHFVARATPWMAERLTGNGYWRCWIAEGGGAILGHLWLQLIEKIPNPGPELEVHAYITNVYIAPSARGGGAGGSLMKAAVAFCRERGVDSVVLWPTQRSRTLYARHGFGRPDDMMELRLDPGRDLH